MPGQDTRRRLVMCFLDRLGVLGALQKRRGLGRSEARRGSQSLDLVYVHLTPVFFGNQRKKVVERFDLAGLGGQYDRYDRASLCVRSIVSLGEAAL